MVGRSIGSTTIAEPLPPRRVLDVSRFEDFARDVAQRGADDQHREAGLRPDIGDRHDQQRRAAEEVRVTRVPSTYANVPPAVVDAYHVIPAVMAGIIQAITTTPPTSTRTQGVARMRQRRKAVANDEHAHDRADDEERRQPERAAECLYPNQVAEGSPCR